GGTDGGKRIPLTPGAHVIGRGDVDIDAGSKTVSPTHARLELSPAGEVVLSDLGSRNGTVVEGYRLRGPLRLEPDQAVQLGAVQLTLAPASQPDRPQLGLPRRGGTVTFNRQPRSAVRRRRRSGFRPPSANHREASASAGCRSVSRLSSGSGWGSW